jgi:hypothetical protein
MKSKMNLEPARPFLLFLLLAAAAAQAQPYSNLVLNGGFETGDFTGWTLSGANTPASVDNGTFGLYSQIAPHSGNYDADFESDGNADFQYLSQTVPTIAGASYCLSFWFDNDDLDFGEFQLSWNGNTILVTDGVGPIFNPTTWTEMQFSVPAAGSSAVLQFGFANLNSIIALDDISVVPAPPGIAGISLSGANLVVNATNGLAGSTNYVLTSTNLAQPLNQWLTVATNVPGANGSFTFTATNAVDPNAGQQFYILQAH